MCGGEHAVNTAARASERIGIDQIADDDFRALLREVACAFRHAGHSAYLMPIGEQQPRGFLAQDTCCTDNQNHGSLLHGSSHVESLSKLSSYRQQLRRRTATLQRETILLDQALDFGPLAHAASPRLSCSSAWLESLSHRLRFAQSTERIENCSLVGLMSAAYESAAFAKACDRNFESGKPSSS